MVSNSLYVLQDVKLELLLPPKSPLISQPPADTTPGSASMLHYTWGSRFVDANGSTVWEFDKRTFTDKSIETQVSRLHPESSPACSCHDVHAFLASWLAACLWHGQ